jgi:hypothetical protein
VALGTDQAPKSGLVHVVSGSADPTKLPAAGTYSFPASPAPAIADITDGSNNVVFRLETAKRVTSVTIADVDTTARTFSLTAAWSVGPTPVSTGSPQNLQVFAGEVVFTGPGGGAFSVPAQGTTVLTGGSDGAAATTASAVLFTNS